MIPRARLLAQLAGDIQRDGADYRQLQQCLQCLHGQLLARHAEDIALSSTRIEALLAVLAQRARLRVRLLTALGVNSDGEAVRRLLGEFAAPLADRLTQAWAALERDVQACRRLNERNGALLRLHRELFQELLGQSASAAIYTAPL